jgi:hypothetical protein
MMWLMADEDNNTPTVIRDENVGITYQVLTLVKEDD